MRTRDLAGRLGRMVVLAWLCGSAASGMEVQDTRAPREQPDRPVRVQRPQQDRGRPARDSAVPQQERRAAARRHLAQLGSALEVYREAGWERAAAAMERAQRAARLELEAAAARAQAPGPEDMAALLEQAAALQRERGQAEAAQSLSELARRYRARSGGEGAVQDRADPTAPSIDDLARRIEIVRMAVAAHREAGRHDGADLLRRFLRVAEMQRDGASGTAITQSLDGLDLQAVLGLLREAGELYRGWDRPERAEACITLARFYAQRWSRSSVAPTDVAPRDDRPAPDAERPGAERTEVLRRMSQRMERLEAELQELRAALRRLAQDSR